MNLLNDKPLEGILLIDKPSALTSFSVVAGVRKKTSQKKIGHTGTLDPFATGLLVLLLGRGWTRKADSFLTHDKEYKAVFCLGKATDTQDCEGNVINTSERIPTEKNLEDLLPLFQGTYAQIPPMFSAKKIDGTRLYKLARKGIVVERKSVNVEIKTTLLSYSYPYVSFHIQCSKGTYIRSLAHDFGERLGCFAHVASLERIRSGPFLLEQALSLEHCLSLSLEQIQERLLYTI